MKKYTNILILLVFLSIFFLGINFVFAQSVGGGPTSGSETVTLPDPLGGRGTDVRVLIGTIIKSALGIVGSLALAMVIYGGFIWMIAAGNNEKVQKGKDILTWAVIGLVVIFSSYGILNQVFKLFEKQ